MTDGRPSTKFRVDGPTYVYIGQGAWMAGMMVDGTYADDPMAGEVSVTVHAAKALEHYAELHWLNGYVSLPGPYPTVPLAALAAEERAAELAAGWAAGEEELEAQHARYEQNRLLHENVADGLDSAAVMR